jgi:hypothetical protein
MNIGEQLKFVNYNHRRQGAAPRGAPPVDDARRQAPALVRLISMTYDFGGPQLVRMMVLSGAGVIALWGAQSPSATGDVVDFSHIWVDTVKRGDMSLEVRGLGKLTTSTTADLLLPTSLIKEVQPGQIASIQFHKHADIATGKVTRITPGVEQGTVTVQIDRGLPRGAQPGVEVEGTIELGHISDVLKVGRPLENPPNSEGALFKLEPNGEHAVRVKVKFGRASVNTIQILSGLEPGDEVILSDTSAFKGYDRITLK